ncbi:MAG: glycosyltransferase family 39 protein [Acidobacteria bacterium]|nr:glycosyltransferase family 39 protein [Acidobacteriota bacterium]MBI3421409.1 glycosyltransferase family 39 protein [Acidobacteriota bacterium]
MYRAVNDLPFGILILLVLAGGGAYLLTLTQRHRESLAEQVKLFLVALLTRFAMAVTVYEFGLVQVLGDEDSSGWLGGVLYFNRWAQRHMSLVDLPGELLGAFEGQHRGYSYLVGTLFYFTGEPARLSAAALNCFFGALTVVFVYRIARTLFSPWVATRAGWLACFFPSMIIWSAQTLKEPVVILLETVALYGCVQLKLSGFSLRYVLLCGFAIVLLLPFRFYAAYIAAAAAVVALTLPRLSQARSTFVSGVAVVGLVGALAVSSGLFARNEAYFEKFDLQMVQNFRHDVAKGAGSGVENNFDIRTPGGLVLGTAVGAAHLALAPFPWQLGGASVRALLTLPELLVWWYLFFAGLLPGLWYLVRQRFSEVQPMLFFVAGLGLLYSMMFGNVGLIFRQRAQLLPWLLIFAVVGLQQRRARRWAEQQPVAALPVWVEPEPELRQG